MTPATATGTAAPVSRITFATNTGRVSSLPLGGGLRNQCTLVQPWPACQTRFGNEQDGRDRHGRAEGPACAARRGAREERRDQQDEDDGEGVLRLEADAGGDSEQRPGAAAECESQREPEDDHRRQLVERDRLEEQIGREHRRTEPDHDRCERLRPARRPELTGDKGADEHRSGAREDRERPQADERPAEQPSGQRRKQRRHRWELDIAALKMQAGDGVIQLVAMPAVTSGDRELQRALQRDDEEHGSGREDDRAVLCPRVRHSPPSLEARVAYHAGSPATSSTAGSARQELRE